MLGGGSSGPNVGAIAGGVIGGVIFIAIATFLVWRFCIRPRRQRYEEAWEEEDDVATQKHAQFNELRDQRASVHTVHSMASTILSRASNVIPIAFIPGVTNRDGSNAPPVPPIPAARADGAIFFKPGDIRGSAYSDASSIDNRSTFFGRPSITPSLARSSVGDIYRGDAVVNPMPAQTVLRGKANMVSVKSSQTNSPTEGTTGTATPINIFERDFGNANDKGKKPAVMMPSSSDNTGSPSPAGSIRSGASFVKPNIVSVGTKNNKRDASPSHERPRTVPPLPRAPLSRSSQAR
ncbi:hypothetical protein H2203_004517 [Taxawa tesnikishii (nom. ined.)]|nr:hypothetical protein H2203_004517 [Dothideales sp. JES 119]